MKQYILTGGILSKPDSLLWCSDSYYQVLQAAKEDRMQALLDRDVSEQIAELVKITDITWKPIK
jgi:hypothetical protein